jgi:hypothetical protein
MRRLVRARLVSSPFGGTASNGASILRPRRGTIAKAMHTKRTAEPLRALSAHVAMPNVAAIRLDPAMLSDFLNGERSTSAHSAKV